MAAQTMKKTIAFCVLLLLCLGLSSCAGSKQAAGSKFGPQASETNRRDRNTNQDKTLGQKGGTADGAVIVRADAENLVEVRIKNGEASVTLNAARFDALYDYSKRYESEIYTGSIQIAGTSGKIKDACIAQIPELDFLNGTDFTAPTIFLLMENGTVEQVFVDFVSHDSPVTELHSFGPLPWIESIVSLSNESDGEGFGAMTVFAEDKKGVRYDLRIPASFCELYTGSWVCDLRNGEGYYGVLNFDKNGTAVFEKGWMGGNDPARYTGTFDVSIAENSGIRPGMMTLDLHLDAASNTKGAPKKIRGVYFAEAMNLIGLKLWYSDGDYLHTDQQLPMTSWDFTLGYNPFRDNPYTHAGETAFDSYTEYLLSTIDRAREMVESYGMAIRDTGEYAEINGGYCRLISLGTNHPQHFSGEIHYAISGDGVIYEYDVIQDEWIVMWVPD